MQIKIMIADKNNMIRQGIKYLLDLVDNIDVLGEISDGTKVVDFVAEYKPDILLLDIDMPQMNGIDILHSIKNNNKTKNVKVVILTLHSKVEYVMEAVKQNCDGYILKTSRFENLKKAIKSVMEDVKYIEPELIPILNNRLANSVEEERGREKLTSREIEVLKLVASGMANKEIADMLDISERTVKNHISNIFKKINVTDRTQAAIFAIKYNIIEIG